MSFIYDQFSHLLWLDITMMVVGCLACSGYVAAGLIRGGLMDYWFVIILAGLLGIGLGLLWPLVLFLAILLLVAVVLGFYIERAIPGKIGGE